MSDIRLLISSDHLSKLITKATDDMKGGGGTSLLDLAGVMASVAEAQDQPILHALPHAIGGYGSELLSARSVVALPVLPEPIRTRLTATITKSVEEATSSLNVVREQLCDKKSGEVEYGKLMVAVGGLFQQATILAKQGRVIGMPRGHRSSSSSED